MEQEQGRGKERSRIRLDSSQRRTIKVVLIGDSQSGKTSLRNRWLTNKFSSNYSATIGVDFMTKSLPLYPSIASSKSKVTLSCWDTAGQERFRSISSSFYRGADAVVIQFDSSASNQQQRERIKFWFDEFIRMAPIEGKEEIRRFTWIVVGGKSDLLDSRDEIREIEVRNFLDELLPRNFDTEGFKEELKVQAQAQDIGGIPVRGYKLDDQVEISSNSAIKSNSLVTNNSSFPIEPKENLDVSDAPAPPKEVLSRPDPNLLNPPIPASTSIPPSKSDSKPDSSSSLISGTTPSGGVADVSQTPRPRHKSLNLTSRKSIKSINVVNPTHSDDEFQNSWTNGISRSGSKVNRTDSAVRQKSLNSTRSNQNLRRPARNSSLDSSPSKTSKDGISNSSSKFDSKNSQRKRFDSTTSQLSVSTSIYHTPRNSTYFSTSSFRTGENGDEGEEAEVESNFSFHDSGSPPIGRDKKRRGDRNHLEIGSQSSEASGSNLLRPSDPDNVKDPGGDVGNNLISNPRNSLALSDRSSTPTLKNRKDDQERSIGNLAEDDSGPSTPRIEKEVEPLMDEMILRSSSIKARKGQVRDRKSHVYDDVATGKRVSLATSEDGGSEDETEKEIGLANPILNGDPIPFPTSEEIDSQSDEEEEEVEEENEALEQNQEDWDNIPIRKNGFKSNGKAKAKAKAKEQRKAASRDRKSRDVSDPFSTLRTIPPEEMDETIRTSSSYIRSRNNSSVKKGKRKSGYNFGVEEAEGDSETISDPEPFLSSGFSLIYTSAKTGSNVSKVFQTVVERVVERWELEEWEERERGRMRRQFIKNDDKRKSVAGNWNFGLNDLGRNGNQELYGPPLGIDEESHREAVRRGIRIAAGKDPIGKGGWKSCC